VCAQAYVALARAESGFPSWPGLPPRERFPKVKEAATKAIELESNNAAAHALLGGAAFNTGEWCAFSFISRWRQVAKGAAVGMTVAESAAFEAAFERGETRSAKRRLA
jgi:hypothetical protein